MSIHINYRRIEYGVYPGGEVYIKSELPPPPPPDQTMHIITVLENSNDIMALLFIRNFYEKAKAILHLQYTPYARQDRVIQGKTGNQVLTAKIFANLVNSMDFESVLIYDPHSNVMPALIDRSTVVDQKQLCVETTNLQKYDLLIAPDLGAYKKTEELAASLTPRIPFVYATKSRNPENGYLEVTGFSDLQALEGKYALVVDDICDGGGTFINLIQYLTDMVQDFKLDLYVTHGIFSKTKQPLYDAGYQNIYSYYEFETYRTNEDQ